MLIYYLNITECVSEMIDQIVSGDLYIIQYQNQLYLGIAGLEFRQQIESNQISYLYKGSLEYVLMEEDCILFYFDAVHPRAGKGDLLYKLLGTFSSNVDFLLNDILAVLNYHEDKLNLSYLLDLYHQKESFVTIPLVFKEVSSNKEILETAIEENKGRVLSPVIQTEKYKNDLRFDMKNLIPPERYLFYGCLDEKYQQKWHKAYAAGRNIRDIYKEFRAIDKSYFNNALRCFRKAFPGKNIYSLKEDN